MWKLIEFCGSESKILDVLDNILRVLQITQIYLDFSFCLSGVSPPAESSSIR